MTPPVVARCEAISPPKLAGPCCSLAGRPVALDDLDLGIKDVPQHLTKVPHVMVPMSLVLGGRLERAFSAREQGSRGTLSV
jgi:hypothetical protein